MRVYLAGPMTGFPEKNFPAFHAAAAALRAEGLEVVSPAEINEGVEHEGWAACMRRDLVQILTCDAIYLLMGWARSRGATLELRIAQSLEFKVRRQGEPAFVSFAEWNAGLAVMDDDLQSVISWPPHQGREVMVAGPAGWTAR